MTRAVARSLFVSAVVVVALVRAPSAQEAEQTWSPQAVFNHESSMALDANGALVTPHPQVTVSRMLTGTDGGKDVEANNPKGIPDAPPFADTFGQAVKLTDDYLFVSALTETNEHSAHGGGAIYVYRRDRQGWVFTQKLTGAEAGEPWKAGPGQAPPVPGISTLAADEDDLLIGVIRTLHSKDDGVLAYRLRDATGDGIHNPIWQFNQKIVRPVPADFPPASFGTRVAMDGDWAFVASNHERLKVAGAQEPSEGVRNAGAVYVFRRTSEGDWGYVQRLTQPDGITEHGTLAGRGLAVQGSHAIVVAARPRGSGYVYELRKPRGPDEDVRWEWTGQTLTGLDKPDPSAEASPEPSPLVAPALDGDWLIMGAPAAGSAYLYRWQKEGERWEFQRELAPEAPQPGSGFGFSAALGGGRAIVGSPTYDVDLDGDGTTDVVDAGAAYVLATRDGTWEEVVRLQSPEPRAADAFGGLLGGVSLTPTHAAVGMFINSRAFNSPPGLEGTNAGRVVIYSIPR